MSRNTLGESAVKWRRFKKVKLLVIGSSDGLLKLESRGEADKFGSSWRIHIQDSAHSRDVAV